MKGVTLTPLKRIATPKGDVLHAMRRSDEGFAGFGEVYFSHIRQGEKKGWKRHNRMTLNLVVVSGKIRFYIEDDRADSPTKGQTMVVELSPDDNYQRLTIEPKLWMAFEGMGEGESILMDIIPEEHDDNETDKRGL